MRLWRHRHVISVGRLTPALLGLAVVAGMCVFPPWIKALGPAGPAVWSSKRQRFEVDGRPASPSFNSILERAYRPWEDQSRAGDIHFVRIDHGRLLVQVAAVAALVGIVMLLPIRGRERLAAVPPSEWPVPNFPGTGPMVTATGGSPLPENLQRAMESGADPSKIIANRKDPPEGKTDRE